MVKKILGIFIIIAGLGGVMAGDYLLAIIVIGLGIFIFIRKPKDKRATLDKIRPPKIKRDKFIFRVKGISDDKIQKNIKEYVKEEMQWNEPYQGVTNKEFKEDYYEGDKLYYADLGGYHGIKLLLDSDDKNIIEVVHDDIGYLGYVPKEDSIKVRELTETHKCSIKWDLIGGKFKYLVYSDYSDDASVETDEHTYGMQIEISWPIESETSTNE